jgi:predicted HicB family RNase H-like nuclease
MLVSKKMMRDMAKTSGKSLNQWAEEVLGKAAHV